MSNHPFTQLLTRDEAVGILSFSCEDPFPISRWLNAWLVQNRRDPLVKSSVGPFFRLLYQGLKKLPQKTLEAGRGVLVSGIPVLGKLFCGGCYLRLQKKEKEEKKEKKKKNQINKYLNKIARRRFKQVSKSVSCPSCDGKVTFKLFS